MMLFICVILSVLCSMMLTRELGSFDSVHLITQYYHDRNATRHLEYDYALCMNLKNPAIGAIHLLQSPNLAARPIGEEELWDFCKPEWRVPEDAYGKVIIHTSSDISDRLKFGEAVSYAIRHTYNELAIIANSDIYFDETLSVLVNNPFIFYDLRMMRKNYWLSRYEKDESANLGTQCGPKFRGTHDAFVFCPTADHEYLVEKTQYMLGTWGLANRVIYELREKGLYTKNPCMTIKAWHSHSSEIKGQKVPFVGRGGSTAVIPATLFDEARYTSGETPPEKGLVIPKGEVVTVYV